MATHESLSRDTEKAAPLPVTPEKPVGLGLAGGLLRLCDLLILGGLGLLVHVLYSPSETWVPRSEYLAAVGAAMLISGTLFQWFGVYQGDFFFHKRLRLERVLPALAVSFSMLLAIAFALKVTSDFSRVWAVSWFVSSCVVLGVGRIGLSFWIAGLARQGRFASRTVIVGAGEQGQRLARHLNEHGDANTRIIGFIDDRSDRVPPSSCGYAVLGNTDYLIQMARQDLVDQIFVALPWNAEARLRQLMYGLAETPVPIHLAPDAIGFEFPDRHFSQVAGLPMLHVFERPLSGWSQVVKEIEDRCLSAAILLFLAPLMLVIAAAIRLGSKGPVFFKQERYGFNNNLIKVWKFRSMYTEMSDASCEVQTTKDDPRVTPVGRFLRSSSLDELPQLFNVLFGEMSLVGPRPHALSTKAEGRLFEEVVERYAARHNVKPGITGWAQVNGWRGETDTVEKIRKRVEHDLYYIDNWSVWLDFKILVKTFLVAFNDENAY